MRYELIELKVAPNYRIEVNRPQAGKLRQLELDTFRVLSSVSVGIKIQLIRTQNGMSGVIEALRV